MTTNEIITSTIAVISLIASVITAYLTLFSGFKGVVLPKRRLVLTQVDKTLCLGLECEFVNDGAKPGSIDDILIKVSHLDTGYQYIFVPYLVREQYNVLQRYQMPDFIPFSGISIGAKQRKEMFIVFKPMQDNFDPPIGRLLMRTSISANIKSKKWTDSPNVMSFSLDKETSLRWTSPEGLAQQIPAIEIGESRRRYLEHQK